MIGKNLKKKEFYYDNHEESWINSNLRRSRIFADWLWIWFL